MTDPRPASTQTPLVGARSKAALLGLAPAA